MTLRNLGPAIGVGFLFVSALLAVAFEGFYWRWRDCFNELGRCYDPETQTVYLQQSGIIWGTLSAISLLLGLRILWKHFRTQ